MTSLLTTKDTGGEGGIRTHGGRKPTPVFETERLAQPSAAEGRFTNFLSTRSHQSIVKLGCCEHNTLPTFYHPLVLSNGGM
jgi:hypothetical protein